MKILAAGRNKQVGVARHQQLQEVLGLRRRTRPMETVQLMGAAGAAHRKTQRQVLIVFLITGFREL